ncbi:ABC transporter permease [Nocardia macrotermitis]|uniref:ABC transporter permease n=1 Tax=Nocardia macrotermitis TaxID=2585198 RepID=UPI00222885E1|nr:ABC transporter permease [Nocardia macrotermitis]
MSGRAVRGAARERDLAFGFLAPMLFFACFYLPLRYSMRVVGYDYAQYFLPVIVVQGMFFTAMSAADRAARDAASGVRTRLSTLPIEPWVVLAARMWADLIRGSVAIAGAVLVGTVFGFRFHNGLAALVFVAVALLFGAALVLGADALGNATAIPKIGAQVLVLPQLLLIMASTGFVPTEWFPGWLQPFVRNQPVSAQADALRDLGVGRYTPALWHAMVWSVALTGVFAAVSALLLMYQVVFGKLFTVTSGHDSIYRFVPLVMVMGALLGAIATGGSLLRERETGLLWRWWVLPGNRAAVPVGGLLAECVRALLTAVLLLAIGVALGLRFHRGWFAATAAICVPVLLLIGLATMVIGLAVTHLGRSAVELSGLLILLGGFFNTGFVPAEHYPGPLQFIVRVQPMSTAVDAMRGLIYSGPVLTPLLATAAWSLGFAVIFGTIAAGSYRTAVPEIPVR